jgi:hypothetical protein
MADTYFIDGTTPIVASWLNDVNNVVYGAPIQQGVTIATSGQTVFTTPFYFVIGSNTLNVYINGLKQAVSYSYTETTTNSITFSSSVPLGALVEFVS